MWCVVCCELISRGWRVSPAPTGSSGLADNWFRVLLLPLPLVCPATRVVHRSSLLRVFPAELLPPNDGDITDWIADALDQAESAIKATTTTATTTATSLSSSAASGPASASAASAKSVMSFINYNLAVEYLPELGFSVAVDGAMRLGRPLPAACIISTSPPGSMYQVIECRCACVLRGRVMVGRGGVLPAGSSHV